jgi:hypothetical protein
MLEMLNRAQGLVNQIIVGGIATKHPKSRQGTSDVREHATLAAGHLPVACG